MVSTLVSFQAITQARRWDFEYFDPAYTETVTRIQQSGWPVRLLNELVSSLTDGQHGYLVHLPEGIPLLRTTNVSENEIILNDVRYIAPEVHNEIKRSQLQQGDVLLTTIGSIGVAAVVDKSLGDANINQNLVKMTPKDEVNPWYLALFFNSHLGRTQTERAASKSVVPIVNYSRLRNIMVPLPPRDVQDRIAQVMQDAYVTRRVKLAEAEALLGGIDGYVLGRLGIDFSQLQEQRAALKPISAIIGGRFDFEAVVTVREIKFNDTQPVVLRQIVRQINERVTPTSEHPDQDINYISLGHIAPNIGELVDFSPVKGSSVLSSSPKFKQGDILYGRMRPYLNKVWIAEFDGICTGEALVFRPIREKVDTHFLHSLLLSRITLAQVVPLQSGTSLPRVSASDVLSVKLPIPKDLEQQIEIGEEVMRRRAHAKRLRAEAETVVAEAKAQVERMILGEG